MHSIERYGIVALLFLVVTVVAVLMWDGGKSKKKDVAGSTAVQAAAPGPGRMRSPERDEARRLNLLAESQPGPLLRQPKVRGAGATDAQGEAPPAGGALAADPLPRAANAGADSAPAVESSAPVQQPGTRPEEPARDPIVGRAGQTHPYSVRSGDTLSEIAQRELGSARRWPEIVAANPGLDPARLRVGKAIQIPGEARASSTAPSGQGKAETGPARAAASPARTWKVGKGENLWKIAERTLGDGKRWPEIAALNPRMDPDRLELGQVLTLPGASVAPAKQATAQRESERPPVVASRTGETPASGRRKVR